jgi:endonuclease-3
MTPDQIPAVNRLLKKAYEQNDAPVIEFMQAQGADEFHVLVATLLSARTQDKTTTKVCLRLFKTIRKPKDLRRLSEAEIADLIYPVGFYKTKAKHLKAMGEMLLERFNDRVPDTIDELCELPGVGRKTANLVVSAAFDKHGICVDVHVHRICNRLGLIETKTPLESEMALREILPKRYWKAWNRQLVSYGQTICRPTSPKCNLCKIRPYCEFGN